MSAKSIDQLARDHAESAVETIKEIMDDPFAENRDRLAAAREMLDRGYGKPTQAVVALPLKRAQRAMAALYTDDELSGIIDAEFEVREQRERPALPAPADPLLR